ncbi:MAG: hypothetical protein WCD07_10565 [Burkholderiales bacterium]
MTNEHWRYFLALEQDVERTTRFVEPHPSNYKTYSIEFARLIISACSEVDVVAKVLCEAIDPSAPATNMDQYRAVIHKRYPRIHEALVEVPRFGLAMEPWKEWGGAANPGWWKDHQLVKHQRHKHFAQADLEHCIVSAAGLFSLSLYMCGPERVRIEPAMFFDVGVPPGIGRSRRYQLPDDPL